MFHHDAVVTIDTPVWVVDPDSAQRERVAALLRHAGFRAEPFATRQQALEAAQRERPLLAVLAIRLGSISGYGLCRALREEFGESVGIVFVSGERGDPIDRKVGLLVGADDYLAKPLSDGELLTRVRALARRASANGRLNGSGFKSGLTSRELQVLKLLAEGHDQHGIAGRLSVRPKTVAKHIEHILQKLRARSRAETVAIAYGRGLHRSAGEPVPVG